MIDMFARIQHITFFGLLAAVSLGFLYLISDFILPIIWAVVLAIIFYPLSYKLTREFGGRATFASLATMLIAILLVFVPIALMGTLIAKESTDLYHNALFADAALYERLAASIPLANELLSMAGIDSAEIPIQAASLLRSAGSNLAAGIFEAGTQTLRLIAKTLVMLYLLFFLLRDGARVGASVMRALPLGDAKEIFLYGRFAGAVRATVKGSIVVALAQGAVGALLFAVAGVPSPILWGMVMALFALIPGIGPAIVWLPAAIILFAMGATGSAIVILVGGIAIVGTIDNFLRPILMGRDTDMPDALILLSVLGGLGTFGISGIILGPTLAALFFASWQLFEEQYKTQLAERG